MNKDCKAQVNEAPVLQKGEIMVTERVLYGYPVDCTELNKA